MLQVNNASIVTSGDNAIGVFATSSNAAESSGIVTALSGTHVITHGTNAAGVAVGKAVSPPFGNTTITVTGATLTTTGDGSNAVQFYTRNSNITMDTTTSLSTSGVDSHAISLQGGATKTYDETEQLAGTISVTGKDSAAFNATGIGSVLTISGGTVMPSITLGADSWTALAEDGGTVNFQDNSIDNGRIWASGTDADNLGTVALSGTSTATGARLRADANGVIDISGITDKAGFSAGSLSGDSGQINIGTTNLTIDGAAKTTFGGTFTGTGSLIRGGTSGSTTLTGDNSTYKSAVSVTGGTLWVNGSIGGVASASSSGSLGGEGTIGGDVSVAAGGNLLGRQGQVLNIGGSLTFDASSNFNVALGAPDTDGLIKVNGDVTLGGTLNITDLGGFAPGLYRLIDYDGSLLGAGTLSIGDVPDGSDFSHISVNTFTDKQVNLVNMTGVDLNYWDGGDPANHDNGKVDGGNGTWNVTNNNWTQDSGTPNGRWVNTEFAIFTGTAGTVTVDDSDGAVSAAGMQFMVDGYHVEGNAITLHNATDDEVLIRVGVGSSVGKGMTATIASELTGTTSLNKMDHGTLVLAANNSYSGNTTISEGTLQLGDGGETGNVQGNIVNNAALAIDHSNDFTFTGKVSGTGALVQQGSGTLILTADNNYTGGTTIVAQSRLQIGNGGAAGAIAGNVTNDGVLAVNRSGNILLDGAIGGKGSLEQNGSGTTILTGESSYSGGTTINAGILQIGNGGNSGSIAGDVTNHATLAFNRADQLIFSKVISGSGAVEQNGTGTTLLSGANSYTGATRINAGTLQQKMHGSFSAASDYEVGSKGILDIGGYKTTLASLSNSGTVRFGENAGAVVNVTGNYTGNDGTLVLNAVLGDDSSKADLMKVGGDTSGTTKVQVINRGGAGAQTTEGVKIIEVGGQSNGTFTLDGDYQTKDDQWAVVAGAYAYTLHEGGVSTPTDGDWYLRSELKDDPGPIINPGIPLYQGAIQAMQVLNKLPTLQQRVGNRYWNAAANPVIEQGADSIGTPFVPSAEAGAITDSQAVWGRIEAAHNRLQSDMSGSRMKQDINTFIIQAGVDGQFYEGESGRLIGGITGQYGKVHSDIVAAQSDGKVETQGWGLGATLTWYGDNGFYVDGQAQANWYDNDFDSTTANRRLANGRKGFGYALSVETGQRVDLNDYWSLTPQAQLMWSSVDFDSFNDVWDAVVALRDGDSLTGRIGLSADYRNAWRDANGQIVRTGIYGIANLYQELMGDMEIKVAGVNFSTGNDRTWGGIGAGGTHSWADGKYALYGEGSINTSLNHFADSYTLKGSVGFKVKW